VNQSVGVSEVGDEIVFLRTLREGGASRSYGIQCARLAGLPGATVDRARTLLARFEKHALRNDAQQLSLFGASSPGGRAAAAAPEPPRPDVVREALRAVEPDRLSPREALDALYRLRALLDAS
jgi:DNA mismatch repair protein MutS